MHLSLIRVVFQHVPRVTRSYDLGSRRVPGFARIAVRGIIGCQEHDGSLDTSPFLLDLFVRLATSLDK